MLAFDFHIDKEILQLFFRLNIQSRNLHVCSHRNRLSNDQVQGHPGICPRETGTNWAFGKMLELNFCRRGGLQVTYPRAPVVCDMFWLSRDPHRSRRWPRGWVWGTRSPYPETGTEVLEAAGTLSDSSPGWLGASCFTRSQVLAVSPRQQVKELSSLSAKYLFTLQVKV